MIPSTCHFFKSLQYSKVRALSSLHLTQISVDCLSVERVSCKSADFDETNHSFYGPPENAYECKLLKVDSTEEFVVFKAVYRYRKNMPVPVAARSKAWSCGRSLAGIVGSNPTGGMYVCKLRVLCVFR